MTAAAHLRAPVVPPEADHRVFMHGVDWRDHTITVHALRGGGYVEVTSSELVAGIDLALIARLIAAGDPQSEALRAFRRALAAP